jgi:hypothetical protein
VKDGKHTFGRDFERRRFGEILGHSQEIPYMHEGRHVAAHYAANKISWICDLVKSELRSLSFPARSSASPSKR